MTHDEGTTMDEPDTALIRAGIPFDEYTDETVRSLCDALDAARAELLVARGVAQTFRVAHEQSKARAEVAEARIAAALDECEEMIVDAAHLPLTQAEREILRNAALVIRHALNGTTL